MDAVNPLKRIRQDASLSLSQLAERAGVTQALIVRTEQAVYDKPPPALLSFLLDFTDDDQDAILAQYRHFQRQTRVSNHGALVSVLPISGKYHDHPFVNWRLASGLTAQISVCKLFCVHPAVISKFELKPHLLSSLPQQLVSALLEAGYSGSLLSALEDQYRDYRRAREIKVLTESGYGANE